MNTNKKESNLVDKFMLWCLRKTIPKWLRKKVILYKSAPFKIDAYYVENIYIIYIDVINFVSYIKNQEEEKNNDEKSLQELMKKYSSSIPKTMEKRVIKFVNFFLLHTVMIRFDKRIRQIVVKYDAFLQKETGDDSRVIIVENEDSAVKCVQDLLIEFSEPNDIECRISFCKGSVYLYPSKPLSIFSLDVCRAQRANNPYGKGSDDSKKPNIFFLGKKEPSIGEWKEIRDSWETIKNQEKDILGETRVWKYTEKQKKNTLSSSSPSPSPITIFQMLIIVLLVIAILFAILCILLKKALQT
ncbi:MAG: hypothetical protein AB1393_03005 [Candidatus Edwardsbacteria bacterium]